MTIQRRALLALLVASALFRILYVAFGPLDLVADEAYYWDWSRKLDWSYFSKGPLVAWLIRLSTEIGGSTPLFVRLPSILLGCATILVVHALSLRLFRDESVALATAVAFACTPLFNVGGVLMTIDNPVFFFYALSILCAHRAIESDRLGDWLLVGVAFGIGLMAKAVIAFFALSLILAMALDRERRERLRSLRPWIALGVAFLLFVPQILWNAAHGDVMFRDFLEKGEAGKPFRLEWRFLPEMLLTQAGVISPLLFLLAMLGFAASARRARAGDRNHLFLVAFGAPILVFYLLLSFRTRVNPNWPVLGYLGPYLAATAIWMERIRAERARGGARVRSLCYGSLGVGLLTSAGIFVAPLLYPLGFSAHRPIDPTNRLYGWRELGARVTEHRDRVAAEGRPVFVASRIYQVTAQLAFNVEGRPHAYCFSRDAASNQYYFRNDFRRVVGQDAIYVCEQFEQYSRVDQSFESTELLDVVEIRRGGRAIRTYYVFLCRGFRGWYYQ